MNNVLLILLIYLMENNEQYYIKFSSYIKPLEIRDIAINDKIQII